MRELTDREREIFKLIALTGQKTEMLAKTVGISERTVKYHVINLLDALGLDSRIELQAFVLRHVIGRLAEIEGIEFPKKPEAQAVNASEFLATLFEDCADPVGQAFTEPLSRKELSPKAPKEDRRSKHQPRGPYDWSRVDWSRPKAEIAHELGCSRAVVYAKYNKLVREGQIRSSAKSRPSRRKLRR